MYNALSNNKALLAQIVCGNKHGNCLYTINTV